MALLYATDTGDEVTIEESNVVRVLHVGDDPGASTRPDLEDAQRLW